MNKFIDAMKAGRSRFRTAHNQGGRQFYGVLWISIGLTLIGLAYAYHNRNALDALITVIVWLLFFPAISWFWFRWRARAKVKGSTTTK